MLTRRRLLASAATMGLVLAASGLAPLGLTPRAWAQAGAEGTAFVVRLGNALVAIVDGSGTYEDKKSRLRPLLDQSIDVEGIAQFCLGRFWRTATPPQQAEFLRLFHEVLMNNIFGKLGEFKGVTFATTGTTQRDADTLVGTTIKRPNQQANTVQWVVNQTPAGLRIVDVVAEGTSLRLTQRSDYAAYLQRNNNNVDALIGAMRQQIAR